MNRRIHFVMAVFFVLVLGSVQSDADEANKYPRTVTVQGEGKVRAVPDIATLSVEVSHEGAALDAVSGKVREGMEKVLASLKAQKIADKDMQTQLYQVQPLYEYDRPGNRRRKGYVVSNRVAVKVRDLNKTGKTLAATVNAGATSVNGPDFEVDNRRALEQQALAVAMEDAKSKASVLAQAAGAQLGEAVTINQSGGMNWPGPRPPFARAMAATPAAMAEEPIQTGEQSLVSHITATFALR